MKKVETNEKEECTFCKVSFLFAFTVLLFVFVYTYMHRMDSVANAASFAANPATTVTQ